MLISLCLIASGKAKPSKKAKTSKPSEDTHATKDPKATDPEKQTMCKSLYQTSAAAMDDLPPEEYPVTVDPMNVDPKNAKPPIPAQPAQETEDVIVTGTAYTAPGNPPVLSKHSATPLLTKASGN